MAKDIHRQSIRQFFRLNWVPVLAVLFIILACFLPLVLHGKGGLGYDTGFYYIIAQVLNQPDLHFPADIAQSGGIEGAIGFFKLLGIVGFTPNAIVFGWYITITLLMVAALYLYVQVIYGTRPANIAVVLFAISLTQFEAYWYFLYHNVFALLMMFVALWLIEKKSAWAAWPSFFLILIHKATPFVFFPTLSIYLLLKKEWRLFMIEMVSLLIGGLYIINFKATQAFFVSVQSGFTLDTHMIRTGNFIDPGQYLAFAWPYLCFAVWQLCREVRSRHYGWAGIFFLFNALLIAVHFIFYNRLLIYLDIGALILAAPAIDHFLKKYFIHYYQPLLGATLILFFLMNLGYSVQKAPLVTPSELASIESIKALTEPNAFILNIDSRIAPWLEGWSGRKVISPGLLRDRWNYQEWQRFWANDDIQIQKQLLSRYPKPLYLYLQINSFFVPAQDCFRPINKQLYAYVCQTAL